MPLFTYRTEVGHQEIESLMSDIGINKDLNRCRGAAMEVSQDEAHSLGQCDCASEKAGQ